MTVHQKPFIASGSLLNCLDLKICDEMCGYTMEYSLYNDKVESGKDIGYHQELTVYVALICFLLSFDYGILRLFLKFMCIFCTRNMFKDASFSR